MAQQYIITSQLWQFSQSCALQMKWWSPELLQRWTLVAPCPGSEKATISEFIPVFSSPAQVVAVLTIAWDFSWRYQLQDSAAHTHGLLQVSSQPENVQQQDGAGSVGGWFCSCKLPLLCLYCNQLHLLYRNPVSLQSLFFLLFFF